MNFGNALVAMRRDERLARKGWNGSGMFAFYVDGGNFKAHSKAIMGYYPDNYVVFRPYLALKTAQNDVALWTPSCSDILADDWAIVADE